MMESLIIRADASTQIGTGHLMRCLALGQAWKDTGGRATFITACQNEGLLQRLKEEGFDLHTLASPYPDPSDWDYTKDILADHANVWMVLDGYHFDEVYQQRVKEGGHRLLVIDDTAHLKHYYADIVLNQNLHAEQMRYSCEPYTHLLLGTRYVLLRREFLAWKDWKRETPELARRVLVTLGGSDPENHTLKVIQALQKVDIPALEATVVIGASNPHADTLEAAVRQSKVPIRLFRNVPNMPEIMTQADVAISGLGVTCWEMAYMGVPMLVVVLMKNQEEAAQLLSGEREFFRLVYGKDSKLPETTQAISNILLSREMRTKMSQDGLLLVDGLGIYRIIKAMSKI